MLGSSLFAQRNPGWLVLMGFIVQVVRGDVWGLLFVRDFQLPFHALHDFLCPRLLAVEFDEPVKE